MDKDGSVTTNMNEQEARAILAQAGYKDVTEEANAQNKSNEYAVFADPTFGVHYCFDASEVVELAEEAQ